MRILQVLLKHNGLVRNWGAVMQSTTPRANWLGCPSRSTLRTTSAFDTAQPRYVVDKSGEPCCVVGIVGCPRRARAHPTSSVTASPVSE
jgi:hypothetical protein